MKTLKKTLSLTLVFALVFSLMSFAFAADTTTTTTTTNYTDAADITYKEAVDVTSAIGVFQGNDLGAFAPKDNLTREQAAKIICYLSMGQAAADKLSTSSAPFADVAADRWSAGSIAYCQQQGILAGYGDGKFGPTDTVTGYQFAKMLLVCLGYDAAIEGFTGNDWQINVAKRAFQNKLSEGNDAFVGTAAATREEAALYTKNTLLAQTVTYANKGTEIKLPDGTTVRQGASAPTQGATFMASYYSTLKVNSGTDRTYLGKGTDDFGRASNNWTYKGQEIGKYATDSALVYTANMKSTAKTAELTKALKGYTVLDADGAGPNAGIFASINGKPDVVDITASNLVATVAGYTGNGTVVEIGVDGTNAKLITSISVIKSELAQVYSVSANSIVITVKSATVAGQGTYTIKATDDLYASLKGYAVDDYLMITPKWSGTTYEIDSFYAPTKITGYITTVQTNPNDMLKGITVGGKVYYEAAAQDATVATAAPSTTQEATVLLDKYGYAVRAKAATAATTDFIYVLDAYSTLVDGKIVPMAKGILTNGTTVDVEVAGTAAQDCTLYACSVTNDVYTLSAAIPVGAAGSAGALAAVKDVVALTGKIDASDKALDLDTQAGPTNYYNNYYASNVKFIYVNTTAKTATVKEGVQEVAAIPATAYAIVEKKSASDATPVVTAVILVDGIAATVASDSLIFFPNTSPVASTTLKNTATGKNETFPVYVGYINGVQTMIPTKTAPAAAGTYYAYAKNDNVPGAIVLGSAPYTVTTGTTSTFGGQVISAFDDKLVTLHTTVPSAATMPNIDISGATIVDVRTDADKDSKPVVLTAAGLCDAINYNLKLSVVFNADTGKASLVYVCSRDVAYTNAFTSTANVSVAGGGVYSVSIDKASASAGQTITVTYTVVTVCPATSDKLVLTGTGIGVTTPAAGTGVVFTSGASVGDTATVTYVMPAAKVTDLAVTGTHTA